MYSIMVYILTNQREKIMKFIDNAVNVALNGFSVCIYEAGHEAGILRVEKNGRRVAKDTIFPTVSAAREWVEEHEGRNGANTLNNLLRQLLPGWSD